MPEVVAVAESAVAGGGAFGAVAHTNAAGTVGIAGIDSTDSITTFS